MGVLRPERGGRERLCAEDVRLGGGCARRKVRRGGDVPRDAGGTAKRAAADGDIAGAIVIWVGSGGVWAFAPDLFFGEDEHGGRGVWYGVALDVYVAE